MCDRRCARILLHSSGVDDQPVLIPCLAEPLLEERPTMISLSFFMPSRRRLDYAAMAALLFCSAAIAQSTQTPAADAASHPEAHCKGPMPPPYPPDVRENHEQGMVMLKVLVGT